MVIEQFITEDLILISSSYQEDCICRMYFFHSKWGFFTIIVRNEKKLPDWIGFVLLVIDNKSIVTTTALLEELCKHRPYILNYYEQCIEQESGE